FRAVGAGLCRLTVWENDEVTNSTSAPRRPSTLARVLNRLFEFPTTSANCAIISTSIFSFLRSIRGSARSLDNVSRLIAQAARAGPGAIVSAFGPIDCDGPPLAPDPSQGDGAHDCAERIADDRTVGRAQHPELRDQQNIGDQRRSSADDFDGRHRARGIRGDEEPLLDS